MTVPIGRVEVLKGLMFGDFCVSVLLQENDTSFGASVWLEGVAVQTHDCQDARFAEKKVADC
jgi:hypothetical protein